MIVKVGFSANQISERRFRTVPKPCPRTLIRPILADGSDEQRLNGRETALRVDNVDDLLGCVMVSCFSSVCQTVSHVAPLICDLVKGGDTQSDLAKERDFGHASCVLDTGFEQSLLGHFFMEYAGSSMNKEMAM